MIFSESDFDLLTFAQEKQKHKILHKYLGK
jgi:hypothetical protein